VRIVGGKYGGRRLVMPKDARVRPTADRVREAWMSILGDALTDARVLDLFAGSGALGLEALSRGAASASFVELNPPSLRALEENIATLGVADAVTDAFFPSSIGPTSSSPAIALAAMATPPSPSATRHDSHCGLPRLVRSTDEGP